jgi:hypothetical protein
MNLSADERRSNSKLVYKWKNKSAEKPREETTTSAFQADYVH